MYSCLQFLNFKNSIHFEIFAVLGDDPVNAGLVKGGSQLGVQKPFPAQPMFPQPAEA